MGNCVSTKRCFFRFARRRRVRKGSFAEAGERVEECVEEKERREERDRDSECSQSLREFLFLERMCEEYEEMEEKRKKRIEEKKMKAKAEPKKVEERESRVDRDRDS
ncbi:unnamed protein product [Hymenolepis diminuta]|uniref:Uncharacterized protein n=1 Tax=Hymenolepis diminuta TaxID=6216 RepID=A0A564YTV9_HYMDI|nr:unnamed protein product [Hymenolepis diminuta]